MFTESSNGYYTRLLKKVVVIMDKNSRLHKRLEFVLKCWREVGALYFTQYAKTLARVHVIEGYMDNCMVGTTELKTELDIIIKTGVYPSDPQPILDCYLSIYRYFNAIVENVYAIALPEDAIMPPLNAE